MAMRTDVRIRFHGVQKPVTAEVVGRVEVEVLAPPRVFPGLGGKPVEQFLVDYFHVAFLTIWVDQERQFFARSRRSRDDAEAFNPNPPQTFAVAKVDSFRLPEGRGHRPSHKESR